MINKLAVEERFVIDGSPVDKVASFGDITIYQSDNSNSSGSFDEAVLYFTKKNIVIQKLEIGADCDQIKVTFQL